MHVMNEAGRPLFSFGPFRLTTAKEIPQ
jgi:hypothetical protein